MTTIRPARASDAPGMAALYRRSVETLGARDYSPEQVRAWADQGPHAARFAAKLADGRRCWIAEGDAGGMQGFVDLEGDGHVDFLYVDPDAAGQGVAGRLLDKVADAARVAGLSRLFVEASETARPVFERRGWSVVGRRDFEVAGVPIHNWAMEVWLDRLTPGALVKYEGQQSGGPEYGVVVHCWLDEKLGAHDCYVAFFGHAPPDGRPVEKPYVLRYAARSLTVLD